MQQMTITNPLVPTQPTATNGGPNSRIKATLKSGGLYYSFLYLNRWLFQRITRFVERRLVAIEQRRGLVESWTISAQRHTAAENKQVWNTHDWTSHGEEWTPNAEWKQQVIDEFLLPNIRENTTVVEIGPGGGRWTDVLQRRVTKLYVVDVAERPIQLCRERFAHCVNIDYVVGDGASVAVPDASVDAVWSYDVFVHINPIDARAYSQEFSRILKPGGRAIIHHPGDPDQVFVRRPGWRSDLTNKMVLAFLAESGLRLISQTTKLVNPGDVLSVIEKPA